MGVPSSLAAVAYFVASHIFPELMLNGLGMTLWHSFLWCILCAGTVWVYRSRKLGMLTITIGQLSEALTCVPNKLVHAVSNPHEFVEGVVHSTENLVSSTWHVTEQVAASAADSIVNVADAVVDNLRPSITNALGLSNGATTGPSAQDPCVVAQPGAV